MEIWIGVIIAVAVSVWALRKEESASKKLKDVQRRESAVSSAEYRFERYREEEDATIRRRISEVEHLAEEKSVGFPWLASAYADYFSLEYEELASHLDTKRWPAHGAADQVRAVKREFREADKRRRVLQYVVDYYESLFPWLEDLRDPDIDDALIRTSSGDPVPDDGSRPDPVRRWLTDAEYARLSSAAKSDLALERYIRRRKTNWEIGRDYERYIGYTMEQLGYAVSYQGIIEGLADLGRDLVCVGEDHVKIIQCKRWSTQKEIHEKHVFQLFGTLTAYRIDHPGVHTDGVLATSTKLSARARQFADELEIEVWDELPPDQYPMVKCNVSHNSGEKIYHLPFDQMYDRTIIEPLRGEGYAWTAEHAEAQGFRRALKWSGPAE